MRFSERIGLLPEVIFSAAPMRADQREGGNSMRSRQNNTSGTLNRLNEALKSLESRIDMAKQEPVQNQNDLALIRARQNALSYPARQQHQTTQSSMANQSTASLQQELGDIKAEMERIIRAGLQPQSEVPQPVSAAHEQTGRRDASHNSVMELRADIHALKGQIAQLSREDTLKDLIDRSYMIENNIQGLPDMLGSRDELLAMADRLDNVQHAIARLPQSDNFEQIENQFTSMASTIERMGQQLNNNFQSTTDMDARFDEISRALASIPNSQSFEPAMEHEALERIEARIANLAIKLDENKSINRSSVDETHILDLVQRLDTIQQDTTELRVNTQSTFSDETVKQLAEGIDALSSRISNAPDHAAQERMNELITSLDSRLDEISARFESALQGEKDTSTADILHQRLDMITKMLTDSSAGSDQQSSVDLQNLEAQIAHLAQSLNDTASPFDEESIMTTARAAAEEAVRRIDGNASHQGIEQVYQLANDLKALESLARDSDDRHTRTFSAIHDTLLKVVDHLSGLEDSIASAPSMMQADTHNQYNVPRQEIESPSIDPVDEHFEAEIKRREALSPSAAASAAAAAAIDSVDAPVMADEGERNDNANGSLLRSMAGKLRRNAKTNNDAGPIEPQLEKKQVKLQNHEQLIVDEPIEPGAVGTDLSAIMRRVREERSASSAQSDDNSTFKKDDSNGKSDFIAAARRAAKAAAQDATLSGKAVEGTPEKGSTLKSILANRRKPILLGVGAILLALLALPFIKGTFAPSGEQENQLAQAVISEPVIEENTEAEFAVDEDNSAIEEIDLQGDITPVVRDVEQNTSLSIGADVATNTNSKSSQVQANPLSQISIDDIPSEAGPVVMREAAASGDAKALYLIGDYYFGGVTGQSGNDLGKALTWYEKSAERGYAPAQYRVGNFYEKGFGGTTDFVEAKKWYQLAAQQGNAAAMHNLAVLLANGVEGKADVDAASIWFKKAAELGVKDSQFNLGILSAQGNGVKQDLAESYKWFSLAAKTGDKDAQEKRDQVAEALRPDQLDIARAAIEAWQPEDLAQSTNIVSIPQEWRTDSVQTTATPPELNVDDMKKAVRNIQGILTNNGYDAGPIDGVMGNKTKQAIIAFQKENGLTPNGEVTQALVKKLLELNEKK